jgi:uncharacterized membrane protein YjjP (DUF1212 family)
MPPDPDDYRRKARFIVKLGIALHECGGTSQRVERHLLNVTRQLGFHGSFLISPTTFTCAFWQDDELDQFVHVERIQPADHNLGLLWEIDRLMERITRGELDLDAAIAELHRLRAAPSNYSAPLHGLAWALIGGSFAALLSSNAWDILIATLLSGLIFLFARRGAGHARWGPVLTLLAPFFSGLLASFIARAGVPINVPFVILSSVIIFVPGLALTVAMTEISSRDLISGTSRLVDALMQLLKLFFGSVSGTAVASVLAPHLPFTPATGLDLPPLSDLKTWPAVLGLSLGLGVAFNIPARKLGAGLLSAALAFLVAGWGTAKFGMFAGMFLGALAVGLYANLFSRITRGPSSIPMMQGIVLLVPGSRTYMILNEWVSGTAILPGTSSGHQALMIFLCLLAGLMISNALLPVRKPL